MQVFQHCRSDRTTAEANMMELYTDIDVLKEKLFEIEVETYGEINVRISVLLNWYLKLVVKFVKNFVKRAMSCSNVRSDDVESFWRDNNSSSLVRGFSIFFFSGFLWCFCLICSEIVEWIWRFVLRNPWSCQKFLRRFISSSWKFNYFAPSCVVDNKVAID